MARRSRGNSKIVLKVRRTLKAGILTPASQPKECWGFDQRSRPILGLVCNDFRQQASQSSNMSGWPLTLRSFIGLMTLWVCLICFVLPSIGNCQQKAENQEAKPKPTGSPKQQLGAELKRIAIKYKMPSMFAGYQTMGKPMVAVAGGFRKNNSGVAVTVHDHVHLGSCTKAMTATMIGRLIERKKLQHGSLRWDTTIEEGLPELVKDLHPSFAKVTMRQLLMHRGGCPANTNWTAAAQKKSLTETRRSLVRIALRKERENKPGDYLYSNLGYVVAGLMAQKATGQSWEDLMQQEIFDPLGLKSAGFGAPGTPGKIDQPWGHVVAGDLLIPFRADNPAPLGPAGTVHMSLEDWAKFCLSHTIVPGNETEATKRLRLVSDETLDFLHKPLDGATDSGKDYALGWRILERGWGGQVFHHSGTNKKWLALLWVSPENQSVYMAVTNCASPQVGEGLDQIFATLIRLEKEARKDATQEGKEKK